MACNTTVCTITVCILHRVYIPPFVYSTVRRVYIPPCILFCFFRMCVPSMCMPPPWVCFSSCYLVTLEYTSFCSVNFDTLRLSSQTIQGSHARTALYGTVVCCRTLSNSSITCSCQKFDSFHSCNYNFLIYLDFPISIGIAVFHTIASIIRPMLDRCILTTLILNFI